MLQIFAPADHRTVRKKLHVDTLIQTIRADFRNIGDRRSDNSKIPLDDVLMSAFAMFHLKELSLLAFDERRRKEPENLRTVYGHLIFLATIKCAPSLTVLSLPSCAQRFAACCFAYEESTALIMNRCL
jgi:hypothetical protein